jgi:hypothetical protein
MKSSPAPEGREKVAGGERSEPPVGSGESVEPWRAKEFSVALSGLMRITVVTPGSLRGCFKTLRTSIMWGWALARAPSAPREDGANHSSYLSEMKLFVLNDRFT